MKRWEYEALRDLLDEQNVQSDCGTIELLQYLERIIDEIIYERTGGGGEY